MTEINQATIDSNLAAPANPYAAMAVAPPTPLSPLLEPLTPVQRKALQQLTLGENIAAAANHAHVCRTTVYRWIRFDPDFRAAYECWQQEAVEAARSRMVEILDEAVSAIRESVIDGNVNVAMEIVRTMGALRRPRRGSGDRAQVARRIEAEKLREEKETEKLEDQVTCER